MTQSNQYRVAVKHVDGSLSYLMVRDRTAWTLRTARKHAKDCTAKILSGGSWAHAKYVTIVNA